MAARGGGFRAEPLGYAPPNAGNSANSLISPIRSACRNRSDSKWRRVRANATTILKKAESEPNYDDHRCEIQTVHNETPKFHDGSRAGSFSCRRVRARKPLAHPARATAGIGTR